MEARQVQFKKELKIELQKYSFKHDDEILNMFDIYYNLLIEKSKQFNLTAITEQSEIIVKHFIDSLLAEKKISEQAYLIDIGSGAGLPAIPLKIIKNNLKVVAVDSVNKKVNFINEVAQKLQLKDFRAIHTRSEDLAHELNYRECFDVAVSRAVAKLNVLCEYALPFLKIGGIMIAYKSVEANTELLEAKTAISKLGGELIEIEQFQLGEMCRALVIIKKRKQTPANFPRTLNKPRTNPIC